jgi:5-methylcytosine-specific restriction endonuclease McrA
MRRVSDKLRHKVRLAAQDRCGYCQSPQHLIPIPFEIEHILPITEGSTKTEENLWLACRVCNSFKHAKTHAIDPETKRKTRLFNPRKQIWAEHFESSEDKTEIIGKIVIALKLNNTRSVKMRKLLR